MILDSDITVLKNFLDREFVSPKILKDLGFTITDLNDASHVTTYMRENDDLALCEHLAQYNDAVRKNYPRCYTVVLHFPDHRYSVSGRSGFGYAIYNVGQLKEVLHIHDVVIPELEKLIEQTKNQSFDTLEQLKNALL